MPTSRALALEHHERLARAAGTLDPAIERQAQRRRFQVRRTSRVVLLAASTAVTAGLATAPQLEAGDRHPVADPPAATR